MIWFFVSFFLWAGTAFLRRKVWLFFLFFLFLLSAFRYYVGSDFDDYVFVFDHAIQGKLVPVEYSYSIIAVFLDYLGFNFQAQIALYSLLTFMFLYKGIRAVSSDDEWLCFLVFFIYLVFYFPSLSIMRQALSASIAFYACYSFLMKGKWFYFVFFVFFSAFFHASGLIYFLCFFCFYIRLSKVSYVFLFAFSFLIGPTFLPKILDVLFSFIGFSYKGYVFESMPISAPIFYIFTSVLIAVFFYSLYVSKPKDFFILNIIALIIVMRILAIDYKPLNRLGASFSIFIPVFLCQVFLSRMRSKSKLIALFITLPLLMVSDFFRANKEYSYYQYSINFCIYGEPCPISVVGDLPLEELKIREELR